MSEHLSESDYWSEVAWTYGNARISDEEYPGVLVQVSQEQRVAVNKDGSRYHFQSRTVDQDGLENWSGRAPGGYRFKASLLKKNPGLLNVPDIAALPDDPAQALASRPDLSDGRRAYLMRMRMNDITREDYGGVIVRDANARLALHSDGGEYVFQMCSAPDEKGRFGLEWRTLRRSRFLSDLHHWVQINIAPNAEGELAPSLFRYFETGISDATENPWLELVGLPYLTRPNNATDDDGSTEG